MTKATGKRAMQKRREDLFWGELRLTRVAQHLMQNRGLLRRGSAFATPWTAREVMAAFDALEIVHGLRAAIHREMAELVMRDGEEVVLPALAVMGAEMIGLRRGK